MNINVKENHKISTNLHSRRIHILFIENISFLEYRLLLFDVPLFMSLRFELKRNITFFYIVHTSACIFRKKNEFPSIFILFCLVNNFSHFTYSIGIPFPLSSVQEMEWVIATTSQTFSILFRRDGKITNAIYKPFHLNKKIVSHYGDRHQIYFQNFTFICVSKFIRINRNIGRFNSCITSHIGLCFHCIIFLFTWLFEIRTIAV